MQLIRLIHTIRYLQFRQLWYRVWYKVKKPFYSKVIVNPEDISAAKSFPSIPFFGLPFSGTYKAATNKFIFLNKEKEFGQDIDWNYQGHGKLWLYNLGYFEVLRDESVSVEQKKQLILSFISYKNKKDVCEPYPISLRGIEWIKFFSKHGISIPEADVQLFQDYSFLLKFPEYHLSGNHLLENGFSLLFAAHYFNNNEFYTVARKILYAELQKQLLYDNGHYEKSPVYHSRLLAQLMSCEELINRSLRLPGVPEIGSLPALCSAKMMSWLDAFAFKNGDIAMFGDSDPASFIPIETLHQQVRHIGFTYFPSPLCYCEYEMLEGRDWELILNSGLITAPHQPGHIHADAGTFCVQWKGKPLIVDTGISTYENNERRKYERSTAAHNTIVINDKNSSEIWAAFRMGRRVNPELKTQKDKTKANLSYSPYWNKQIIHRREWIAEENKIIIRDSIVGANGYKAFLHLHFHPSVNITDEGNNIYSADGVQLQLKGIKDAYLEEYLFARGFNDLIPAKRIRAAVVGFAETEIDFTC